MPIVVMKEGVHASSQNLSRRQDFPTPESPISSSYPLRFRLFVVVKVEATYFDEKVVMWGRHDVVSELKKKIEKNGEAVNTRRRE